LAVIRAAFNPNLKTAWFSAMTQQGPQGASWEGLSAPRARNPLFRRIPPLFRPQRRFYVNTLNLQ